MRCRLGLVIPILLLAGSTDAGTLTSATWLQVIDTTVANQPFAGIPMTRTTGQLGASGLSTGVSIAVSLSYPSFATTAFVPKTANGVISFVLQVIQGGPQAISATANAGNGVPGVPGSVIVMTALHIGMGVNRSMFMVGANTLVSLPLSIGRLGAEQLGQTTTESTAAGPFWTVLGQLHLGTISFFAWTPGTLQFTGLTSFGKALPNVTAAGSFNLTPMGEGTVTLVSPSKISIDGNPMGRRTVSVTTLKLSFVPEPGTLFLLGGAAVVIARFVRREKR